MHVMDPHRRRLLVSAAGLSLSGLSACQRPESLVRVAGTSWVGYAPLYLARELGYLKNTKVRLLELTTAAASLMALAAGRWSGGGCGTLA
jgi:NitT/TauT family transport system substrate-binding protein